MILAKIVRIIKYILFFKTKMKILFVTSYINNSHYIEYAYKTMKKNLINIDYNVIVLNDAPDTKNGEKNYLQICNMLTGDDNCFENIKTMTKKFNFTHIKIPQSIHIENRVHHGSNRHIELLNWFNQNLDTLYPSYKDYDFLCYLDSDAFFTKPVDLEKKLHEYDLAGPLIYIRNGFYIHTGLFFINLKTVTNMKDISWNDTQCTDTGSDILNFIKKNPQYKIKKLGHYDDYNKKWHRIPNNHTQLEIKIPEFKDFQNLNVNQMHIIDTWMDNSVSHLRAGSCFSRGSKIHRYRDMFIEKGKLYELKLKFFCKNILGL